MLSTDEINAALQRQNGFITLTGIYCTEAGDGYCVMEGEVRADTLNNNNTAHGGYLFTLADTAAGLAAGLTEEGYRRLVTQTSTVYYIRRGDPGAKLRAVAKRIHGGRSTGVVSCEIYNEQDKLLLRGEFGVFYLGGYLEMGNE